MVPLTRRRLLQGSAGLLTGLAGCNRSTTSDSSTETPFGGENFERDPERYALRVDGDRPPAWIPDEDGETTGDATERRPDYGRRHGLVASEAVAERMRFADVDGADEARQFVAETDFENETLYLQLRSVGACRTLELCHVRWSDTDVETQYGSYYRDADASCEADAEDSVSWLVRIPDALDPDMVSSYGSGWSSNGCRQRRSRRGETDETTTEPPNLGPAANATPTTGRGPSETTEGEP